MLNYSCTLEKWVIKMESLINGKSKKTYALLSIPSRVSVFILSLVFIVTTKHKLKAKLFTSEITCWVFQKKEIKKKRVGKKKILSFMNKQSYTILLQIDIIIEVSLLFIFICTKCSGSSWDDEYGDLQGESSTAFSFQP